MKASSFLNNQDSCQHPHPATPGDMQKHHCLNLLMLSSLASTQRHISHKSQKEQESSWRHLACGQAQQGNYQEAIAILSQLIERNSENANDYNNRGLIYFQSGQLEKAIADYNRAIQINPQLAGAYNNRANYYASIGQLEAAIADYDKTIDLNPVHVRAWINRGITFRDLGMYDLAIDNFDFALHLGWLEGHIYAERGRTYHLLGDWNYAIADYQRALEHLPQSSQSKTGPAGRLCQQVQTWLQELLSPFTEQ